MAAPSTYTPEQKAAMAELTTTQGMTLRQAQATLAAGHKNLEPCKPSLQTIADEKKKHELAQEPDPGSQDPASLIDGLGRRSLALIGKQLHLIERKPESFDADDMLKIVRTLVEAKGLVQPRRQKDADKPASLLGGLSVVENTSDQANTDAAVTAPVSAREAS